ncbi:MAG: hypothetical protein JWQ09_197 [Segetibacter sp.]|nr:hypothetical protein [Segetibacter sp.]
MSLGIKALALFLYTPIRHNTPNTMKRIIPILLIVALLGSCKKETVSTANNNGPNSPIDKQSVGQSASQLLNANAFTILNLEIQYSPGMKPQDQTVNNLVNFLNTYLNKPGGINVTQKQVGSFGAPTATLQEVANFEDRNRSIYTVGNTISIWIYFADADYSVTDVAGISFWNTSIAVFEKTLQAKSGGVNQASRVKVESGTLMHEMGHLLGLVNTGTTMVKPHEDASHKSHCSNTGCLMYYGIQTSGLMGLNGSIPGLDVDCVNDLRGNGGK